MARMGYQKPKAPVFDGTALPATSRDPGPVLQSQTLPEEGKPGEGGEKETEGKPEEDSEKAAERRQREGKPALARASPEPGRDQHKPGREAPRKPG